MAQTVQFTDTSSGVSSWQWTFGDGSSTTSRNPIHAYAKRGTYTVTLRVGNGAQNLQTSRMITVEARVKRRLS